MRASAAAAALAIALVAAGCGGGGSTSDPGPGFVRGELTKAEWGRRADSYCRGTARAIRPLRGRFGVELGRGDLVAAGIDLRRIVADLEEEGERLRLLGVPTEGGRDAHKFERKLERTIEQSIDLAEALEAEEAAAAARARSRIRKTETAADALAGRLGLRSCALLRRP